MSKIKVDEYIDNLTEKEGIPGADLIVHRNGEEIYRHLSGIAKPKDVYFLYSATKVITATAAMRLLSEQKIGLDDKVSKFLPYYKDVTRASKSGRVLPKREVTVRDLLSMKSGLNYELQSAWINKAVCENPHADTQTVVRAISIQALSFEPGEHFQYSLSHDVLGAVIEKSSGMKLSEYFEKNIFAPLHMNSFGFDCTDEVKANMQEQYIFDNLHEAAVKTTKDNMYRITDKYESGGAGLFGSSEDYMKLADTLCRGGISKDGYKLLPPEYIELMRTDAMDETSFKDFLMFQRYGYTYGLGVRVKIETQKGDSPKGEFGWDSAAGAWVLIDPENGITAFYAQHVLDCEKVYSKIHPQIRKLIYSELV